MEADIGDQPCFPRQHPHRLVAAAAARSLPSHSPMLLLIPHNVECAFGKESVTQASNTVLPVILSEFIYLPVSHGAIFRSICRATSHIQQLPEPFDADSLIVAYWHAAANDEVMKIN
eukprot:scaffold239036_cov19-Prasinocladus_malaysianus.AAC.1